MEEYRKVDNIFDGLQRHVVSSKNLIKEPKKIEDEYGYYIIRKQVLLTLDDGMEVEICQWTDGDLHTDLVDVSIDKTMYDSREKSDIIPYLESKEVYLENVEDKSQGCRWKYGGLSKRKKDVYRIQYIDPDFE